ncbi:hypothetical protein TKK_0014303 [Trichogramma kaykai]
MIQTTNHRSVHRVGKHQHPRAPRLPHLTYLQPASKATQSVKEQRKIQVSVKQNGHDSNVQLPMTTTLDKEYSNDQLQAGPSGTQTPTSTSNQSSIIQPSDSVYQQTTKDSVDADSNNQLQTAGSAMKIFEGFMETSCPNQSSIGQPTDPVLQKTTKNEGKCITVILQVKTLQPADHKHANLNACRN